jgi:uncharacterized caspase-like protein/exonuclease VII small subunit
MNFRHIMASFWLGLMLIAFGVPEVWAQVGSGQRVALVIGNGSYRDHDPADTLDSLDHAKPDAEAIAAKLKGFGFQVSTHLDLTKKGLKAALSGFVAANKEADVALIFFSGHGIQIGERNYLLPIDADSSSAVTLRDSSLPLDEVFSEVAKVAPNRIVLLDACRDDPSHGRLVNDTLSVRAGLKESYQNAFYTYATQPGATAADGTGDHSPFAGALLDHLGARGVDFGVIMKRVQMDVYDRTRKKQVPYLGDSLPALIFANGDARDQSERDRLLMAMAGLDDSTRALVENVATDADVPFAPLYAALLARAGSASDNETKKKLLQSAANEFQQVRSRLRSSASSDPEVTRLRQEAEQHLSLGETLAATNALSKAIDLDLDAIEILDSLVKARKISAATSLAARSAAERLQRNYRAAAKDSAMAASLVEPYDWELAWTYTLDQATMLLSYGERSEDPAIKVELDKIYEKVGAAQLEAELEAIYPSSRKRAPGRWAALQDKIVESYIVLSGAERDLQTKWLEKALKRLREMITKISEDREPERWAVWQSRWRHKVVETLIRIGELEPGTARLEEALLFCRDAITATSKEKSPTEWVRWKYKIGKALTELGKREAGTARLEEAVAAYRDAIAAASKDAFWAVQQNNLAVALAELGKRETGVAQLEEAVAAFRGAIAATSKEKAPEDWARHQTNLGNALYEFGQREPGTVRLEEAVAAYRDAIAATSKEKEPGVWAERHDGLGDALYVLGKRETGTARLEEAVAAYREAIVATSRDKEGNRWATRQNNLGNALAELGKRETGVAQLEEAVAAHRNAIAATSRDKETDTWARQQFSLGNTLYELAKRSPDPRWIDEASKVYLAALDVWRQKTTAKDRPVAENRLGNSLRRAGQRRGDVSLLDRAIEAYRAAQLEWTQISAPVNWSFMEALQSETVRSKAIFEGREDLLHTSLEIAKAAIQRLDKSYPNEWSYGHLQIGLSLREIGIRKKNIELINQAKTAFVITQETSRLMKSEPDLAEAQVAYAVAQKWIGKMTMDKATLDDGIRILRQAIDNPWFYSVDKALAQSELGEAIAWAGQLRSDGKEVAEGMAVLSEALASQPRDWVPFYWAVTRTRLSDAQISLSALGGDGAIVQDAISGYRDVVAFYTKAGLSAQSLEVENKLKCFEPVLSSSVGRLEPADTTHCAGSGRTVGDRQVRQLRAN